MAPAGSPSGLLLFTVAWYLLGGIQLSKRPGLSFPPTRTLGNVTGALTFPGEVTHVWPCCWASQPHVRAGFALGVRAQPYGLSRFFCVSRAHNYRARQLVLGNKRLLVKGTSQSVTLIFNSFQGTWPSHLSLSRWLEGIMLPFFSLQSQGQACCHPLFNQPHLVHAELSPLPSKSQVAKLMSAK